jgi:prophage DNA circulation protein
MAAYSPPNTKLKRASFMGYEFPVTDVSVQGGLRDHIHEYPHANGGSPEKLGRRLYTVKMNALFMTTGKAYPHLWPVTLQNLRQCWDRGYTGPLVIPTIGTMQAYCRNWTTDQTSKNLSGETASLEFVEDQPDSELFAALIHNPVLVSRFGTLNAAMIQADFASEKDMGIFDALLNAVNSVLAVRDTIEMVGNLISAKLLAVADLCAIADKTLTAQYAGNEPLVAALKSIWDTANTASGNFFKDQATVRTYVVPALMSISQVSSAIYQGDSTRGVELMQLNAIEDPFAVSAGTKIRYADATTTGLVGTNL